MKKRIRWWIAAAFVGAGLLFIGFGGFGDNTQPLAVKTIAVDSGPVQFYIRATGVVSSPDSVQVGTTADGRIEQVLVKTGAIVTQGQPLVRLDQREVEQQLAIDQLAVTRIDTSIVQQQRQVEVLRQDHAAGAEPLNKLIDARQRLAMEQVQRREALAKVALTKMRMAQSTVRAPIDGLVTEAHIHPGQVVRSGQALLTLTDTAQQQIRAHIEQGDAPDIKPGMSVRVSLQDSPENAVDEQVLRIEPAMRKEDNALFLPVWISLTHTNLALRPNQQLDVRLLAGERTAQMRLPLEALVSSSSYSSVWLVQSGRLHAQPVTLGMVGDGYAEVLSGLEPGQTVAVPSGQVFKEGDLVSVAAAGDTR
ncbi:MAG: efflux RND transporter periplasmic adaptor subunit [Burkholderiaceae bacterium]|jgi:RND family efflux transporter MFP subunit|nr:efflux RND transporter periplasmic adaptor subunit [Burkholderiaceae bacterium]